MAARIVDAPNHARVHALLVQAIELAARISRTVAAQQDATAAQRRAAAQALQTATTPACPSGWQFSKSGAEVIEAARDARAARAEPAVDLPRTPSPEQDVNPNEVGR